MSGFFIVVLNSNKDCRYDSKCTRSGAPSVGTRSSLLANVATCMNRVFKVSSGTTPEILSHSKSLLKV